MAKPLDLLFTETAKGSVKWSVENLVQMHYLLWCPIWFSFPGFASRSPDIPGHCPPRRKELSPNGSKQEVPDIHFEVWLHFLEQCALLLAFCETFFIHSKIIQIKNYTTFFLNSKYDVNDFTK